MRAIDADAFAKFIDYGHLNDPNEKLYSENDIREMIDMMPTIEVVPVRKGEWVDEYNTWDDDNTFVCSVCGVPWNLTEGTPQDNEMNFCPNCGADMRGEGDETD